ncbi:hypothetical protein BH23BAC1_BH23BAC1_47160 [soil metagenome]
MRDQLIEFVKDKYDSVLHANGIGDITYWISENTPNDYPSLPVFQDKNLLVTISFFKNENEYQAIAKK